MLEAERERQIAKQRVIEMEEGERQRRVSLLEFHVADVSQHASRATKQLEEEERARRVSIHEASEGEQRTWRRKSVAMAQSLASQGRAERIADAGSLTDANSIVLDRAPALPRLLPPSRGQFIFTWTINRRWQTR